MAYIPFDFLGQTINQGSLLSGEDQHLGDIAVSGDWRWTFITTQTTTVVKMARGILGKILINTPVANGTVTLYDDLSAVSANQFDLITIPATLLSEPQPPIVYELEFARGLTVVTGGATMNVLVLWR